MERAVSFLEDKAAVARQQTKGVRRRVATAGFAVATFVHRASRESDPQMHSLCLIANVVRRPDGSQVTPHAYTEGGHYLPNADASRSGRSVAPYRRRADGSVVTSIRSNRLLEVEFLEGCS